VAFEGPFDEGGDAGLRQTRVGIYGESGKNTQDLLVGLHEVSHQTSQIVVWRPSPAMVLSRFRKVLGRLCCLDAPGREPLEKGDGA